MKIKIRPLGFLAWIFVVTAALSPSSRQVCAQSKFETTQEESQIVLAHAKAVMGFAYTDTKLIHYHAVAAAEQNYQSDRTYPPFFSAMQMKEAWLDPWSGVQRVSVQTAFPGGGFPSAQISLTDAKRAFNLINEKFNPLPRTSIQARYLNPWAVIADWAAAGNARFVGEEPYRDYPRVVLTRSTLDGEQSLFIDPKTGFPVKLDLREKHYLWGQRHIEYVYSNWILSGGIMVPGSSFRIADGKTEISQTIGDVDLVVREQAPSLTLPESPIQSADAMPLFLQPLDLKVIKVGPKTYLLSNPGYTEAVTEVGKDFFIFDATQGEERARKDEAAIAKLFPGEHKFTVVVTDLAWPHVAGVRYWVARGATIVSHKAARPFLQGIVDQRWVVPDLLERRRKTAKLKFVGVDRANSLAGGAITLHPIDGIGSEVALMGYLVSDRFLWASDYIQTIDEATSYATQIWNATQRDGLHPERTAAQHLPLTPWARIEELQK